MTANDLIKELAKLKSDAELKKVDKFFKGNDGVTKPFGVKFGDVFRTAKAYMSMELSEINRLLDSEFYEIRMAAVSIMDFQAKDKKTPESRKKELFELYLRRHDRLNNWDFVDRGAYNIIGEFLIDKPHDILYDLAKSNDPWERRTAIVSTYAFIKKGDLQDTFKIAKMLLNDDHELINKAVGSWIREVGKKDELMLKEFLDTHGAEMPRITLRYAVEKLSDSDRHHYLSMGK